MTFTFSDNKTAHRTWASMSDEQLDMNFARQGQHCIKQGNKLIWYNVVNETAVRKMMSTVTTEYTVE